MRRQGFLGITWRLKIQALRTPATAIRGKKGLHRDEQTCANRKREKDEFMNWLGIGVLEIVNI